MKKIVIKLLILTVVMSSFIKVDVRALDIEINAKAGILLEASTGQIIFEKNIDEKLPIASVTKVMTLLLTFQALESGAIALDDEVIISKNAADMGGSQVFLETGEIQTVESLIKAIAIASGNDASVAIGEYIAGSEELFVKKMNDKARELGMNDTNFLDVCGLTDEGHYSTARDIGVMSKELIKYEDVIEYVTTWSDEIIHKTSRGNEVTELWNTNKMIRSFKGIKGLKTGYTKAAGFCITTVATRDDLTLISVILGGESSAERFYEAGKLLEIGFTNYKVIGGRKITEPVGEIEIVRGSVQKVLVYPKRESKLVVPKNSKEDVEVKVELVNKVEAPLEPSSKVGKIEYFIDGIKLGEEDVVVRETIFKAKVKDKLKVIIMNWL